MVPRPPHWCHYYELRNKFPTNFLECGKWYVPFHQRLQQQGKVRTPKGQIIWCLLMLMSLPCIHISIDYSWPLSIFLFSDHTRKLLLRFHILGEPMWLASRDLDAYKNLSLKHHLRADSSKILIDKLDWTICHLSINSANFDYAIAVSSSQASPVEIKLTIVLKRYFN